MLVNLRRLRKEARVSQKKLAEDIGTSQQAINKYENHNIEPDIETLIRLADYFDTSVDYLIGREGNRASAEKSWDTEMIDAIHKLNRKQQKCLKMIIDFILSDGEVYYS